MILTGNGVVERLLGEVAGLIRGVQDLVVEDGEVQGKSETDGVRGRKLGLSNLGGSLVSVEGLVGRVLPLVTDSELGEVTVVVALPARVLECHTLQYSLIQRCLRGNTHILW